MLYFVNTEIYFQHSNDERDVISHVSRLFRSLSSPATRIQYNLQFTLYISLEHTMKEKTFQVLCMHTHINCMLKSNAKLPTNQLLLITKILLVYHTMMKLWSQKFTFCIHLISIGKGELVYCLNVFVYNMRKGIQFHA